LSCLTLDEDEMWLIKAPARAMQGNIEVKASESFHERIKATGWDRLRYLVYLQ
jgi:hypothetical protein